MDFMKFYGWLVKGLLLLLVGITFVGCGGISTKIGSGADSGSVTNVAEIRVGDTLTVAYQDLVPVIPNSVSDVKEDGTITLIFNKAFKVQGKTTGQVETEVHDYYVPKYFKNMTPSVTIGSRFFVVGGEVRNPSRQAYTGPITVLQAIEISGGFTDFANKTKVIITRSNRKTVRVNAKMAREHPELYDLQVFPGDAVTVYKKIL